VLRPAPSRSTITRSNETAAQTNPSYVEVRPLRGTAPVPCDCSDLVHTAQSRRSQAETHSQELFSTTTSDHDSTRLSCQVVSANSRFTRRQGEEYRSADNRRKARSSRDSHCTAIMVVCISPSPHNVWDFPSRCATRRLHDPRMF
jgi:hypothetical protein